MEHPFAPFKRAASLLHEYTKWSMAVLTSPGEEKLSRLRAASVRMDHHCIRRRIGGTGPQFAGTSILSINLFARGLHSMSDEKKEGTYEQPESHELDGEDLEDVSGGTEATQKVVCRNGEQAIGFCEVGGGAAGCNYGNVAYKACYGGGQGAPR